MTTTGNVSPQQITPTKHMKKQNKTENALTAADTKAAQAKLTKAGFVSMDEITAGNAHLLGIAWGEKDKADSNFKAAVTRLIATPCPEYKRGGDSFGNAEWTTKDVMFVVAAMQGWSYVNYAQQRAEGKSTDLVRKGDRLVKSVRKVMNGEPSGDTAPAKPLDEQNMAELAVTLQKAQAAAAKAQAKVTKIMTLMVTATQ